MQGKTKISSFLKHFVANEIDDLIDTFNTLLQELQLAYTQVKQFGQNASHELKTPLTIIQGELEVGLRKNRSLEEYQIIMKKFLMKLIIYIPSLIKFFFYLVTLNKKFKHILVRFIWMKLYWKH